MEKNELLIPGMELPGFPSDSFLNALNDTDQSMNLSQSMNLNLTVEDVQSQQNEIQRNQLLSQAKRRMPYVENFHIPPTETKPTLAGIHLSRFNTLGFTLRLLCGYFVYNPATRYDYSTCINLPLCFFFFFYEFFSYKNLELCKKRVYLKQTVFS